MFRSLFLVTALMVSASAGAQGFDYNFITLQYSQVDFDDVNVDGDGISLGGSFALTQNYHVFGEYTMADLDFGIDADTLSLGFGYNRPLTEAVDFVGSVSYEFIELDAPAVSSVDDTGFGLGLGLRFAPNEQMELDAGIKYVDMSDSDSSTGFGAGFQYFFTEAFTLGLSASWDDDVSAYGIGGRFYFGN